MNLRRLFLYTFVGSVCASALIGIGILIFGSFGELEVKVLLTALTVTVTSILGLACGAYFEARGARILPLIGITLAAIAAVMWMFVIWADSNQGDYFVRGLLSITVIATACSHISLLSLARLDPRFFWLRIAAHATVWPLAALIVFLIWDSNLIGEEITGRVTGVLAILVGVTTLLTPLFHWLSSHEPTEAAIDAEIDKLKIKLAELERLKSSMHKGSDQ
ncbi:MAG: hypothetical protein JO053_00120 [Acidobacteria bacterium]|nr:hypothetical protein [Acidobacteriota bacterium]